MPTRDRIGATGYVGGNALYEIVIAHPGWEITALVRNQDKGVKVVQSYPSIRLVYGTLDDSELIEQETQKADIIYSNFVLLNSFCTFSPDKTLQIQTTSGQHKQ